MGGTGAGNPGVGARRRRPGDRACAGGGREHRASSSHGDLVAAVDKGAENPFSRAHSAAHLTAVTMWIESLRLLPRLPREARIPFANGVGLGFMAAAQAGTLI